MPALLAFSRRFATVAALYGLVLLAPARATDLVADYFSGLDSFQADFSQTVIDSNGLQVQASEGEVWIQRPGHFRWDYRSPYRQLIVSDGRNLWTWDEDLEQASVRPVDEALSSTPAMLLSGYRPLSEVVTWTPVASDDGLQWYRLQPRQADASVEQVRIGFRDGKLTLIEVVDSFGNHTRIRFSNSRRNQPVDPSLFRLELPPGTDIIGTPS